MADTLIQLFKAGGWVMYPLLALSVLSIALSFERALFWLRTNSTRSKTRYRSISSRLRKGDIEGARQLADTDGTVYGRFISELLTEVHMGRTGPQVEAAAHDLAQQLRPKVDRFSVPLSTIVTAAPMLGILGTVTGIIKSFQLLGSAQRITDPALVAGGIAEALYTTAFGLFVALVTLFPYVIFRGQSDICQSRLESTAASAVALAEKAESANAEDDRSVRRAARVGA